MGVEDVALARRRFEDACNCGGRTSSTNRRDRIPTMKGRRGKIAPEIYEIDGETSRVCFAPPESEEGAETLVESLGDGYRLYVMRKVDRSGRTRP